MTQKFFSWLFDNKKRFFLILLGLSFFLRISTLVYDFFDVDESIFAVIAHHLMDGGLLYRDGLDNKPPFIFLFYWFAFSLFGKYNMWGVHLITIFWSLATSWVLYKIARENESEKCGLWAALFYTIFSTTYLPKFIAANINIVMMLPLSLSALYWLRSEKSKRLFPAFLSGIFVGLSFMMKFQAGIQLVVYFSFLLYLILFFKKKISWGISQFFLLMVGFVIPIGVTLGTLYFKGVGDDFFQWVVLGSFHYIQAGVETIPFIPNLVTRGGSFVVSTLILWILSVIALRPFSVKAPYPLFVILWLLLSLIPVCTGGRFYGHYFIQLLPPLCLLASLGAVKLASPQALKRTAFFIILPALFFWALRVDFQSIDTFFPDDQIFEQKKIGLWLKEKSRPQETLFVWGYAPAIYFHAQRKPATRFVWADLFTGKIPGSEKSNALNFNTEHYARPKAWEAFWHDLDKNPPTYFVDTAPANLHNYKKYPLNHYPKLFQYLEDHYHFLTNVYGCPIYKRKQ